MWAKKRLFALFLSILLLCAAEMIVCAQPVSKQTQAGSITVTMHYGDKAVSGGMLTLYRVGDISEDDGNYDFTLSDKFSQSGQILKDIGSAQLAKALADYAEAQNISGIMQNIGEDGKVTFSGLSLGLYLLVQKKSAEGYYKVPPFLVSLPMLEDGSYVYDVDASPKVELRKAPEETEETETPEETETQRESETPKETETPDESEMSEESRNPEITVASIPPEAPEDSILPQTGQLNWPVPVLAALGLTLFAAGWTMRYGKKKSDYEE